MSSIRTHLELAGWPSPGAVLALLKPITWFPPMWAYACGAIAVGSYIDGRLLQVLLGILLAGPLLCGTSQAVNDWFDRDVDAINEPHRVIPSGRVPGQWGLRIAIGMSCLSLAVASLLGSLVLLAAVLGLALAWGYSAPPFRFKQNGWIGNGVVGLSYETLPWLTAAAAILGSTPSWQLTLIALLYGIGAHGILTLNDFKAIKGDRELGIMTLPVQHGALPAAIIACLVMALPQAAILALLFAWSAPYHAFAVSALLTLQIICMVRFVRDPVRYAVWYSAIGVALYVSGMMVSAFALRAMTAPFAMQL
ncbi:chlorophyll synthase ChlG [Peteryoungia desertarenae]|uniref:Chlorophyll synthase ChlG n=1 Tax=Peteryoungia desertarenae TaxID=1813451 RepID=A0ABX6QJ61_9HYPH|nr:chlorophyll synthase ChlG [Peteryoungia desertarenae]QLF68502.1 chlorophyll synthase ChlG [Peteryoungia desertarenae]